MNKDEALKLVKENGLNLKNLSDDLKKDREIVLTAVKNDGFAIADANSSFLYDFPELARLFFIHTSSILVLSLLSLVFH